MVNKRWANTEKRNYILYNLIFILETQTEWKKTWKKEENSFRFSFHLYRVFVILHVCLFESKLWSVIVLFTLFGINRNNLILDTGTQTLLTVHFQIISCKLDFQQQLKWLLAIIQYWRDQVQNYYWSLYFIMLHKHHASNEMSS